MCKRIFNDETTTVGEIPFFKIGSFGKEADAFISQDLYTDYKTRFPFPKKGDILISAAGTIGRTVVYDGNDAYFQDSNIVWIDNDNKNITNEFLYYILQIVKYNTEGGTIQRLYNNILKSTKFSSPSIQEQEKISSFLSLLDERIQTQNKIIEELKLLKNTISKKLFSRQLRFKNENNENYIDSHKRDFFMEIIEDRHGKRSTIIASQLPVSAWHDVIGEQTIADAILDRMVHNSMRIDLKGESLRKKNATTEKK